MKYTFEWNLIKLLQIANCPLNHHNLYFCAELCWSVYLRKEKGDTSNHKYIVDLNNMEPCAEYRLITRVLSINGDFGVENINRLAPNSPQENEKMRVIPGNNGCHTNISI